MDKLIADVAALAAPGSLFHFDFLHLDVLEGRTAAVGYDNTAKASLGSLAYFKNLPACQHFCPLFLLPTMHIYTAPPALYYYFLHRKLCTVIALKLKYPGAGHRKYTKFC